MNLTKPSGIKTFAILQIILSTISLIFRALLSIASLFVGFVYIVPASFIITASGNTSLFSGYIPIFLGIILNFSYLILAILGLIAAIGILKYKEKFRKMLVVIATLTIILNIISIIFDILHPNDQIVSSIAFIMIIYYTSLIIYFKKQNVKKVFIQ